jgi:hypothetical protein
MARLKGLDTFTVHIMYNMQLFYLSVMLGDMLQ